MPVAVLACGPDVVYPRRHRGLHARGARARARAVRAAARDAAVPLELPGAQPDHGRAGADDGRRRGRRPERQPDHERLRPRPGPLGRGGARARDLAGSPRGTNGLLRDGAVPITGPSDVLDELFGAGVAAACRRRTSRPQLSPGEPLAARRPGGRGAPRAGRRDRGRTWAPTAARARAALGRLESERLPGAADLGGWERAAERRRRGRLSWRAVTRAAPPGCSRSPAPTPAAAPASRPT